MFWKTDFPIDLFFYWEIIFLFLMGKIFIITPLLIAGKVRPWKDYVCYTSVFEQGDIDILKPPRLRIPWPS